MIQAVMVISTQAKPRLLKFYNFQAHEKHQALVRSVFQLLSARPDSVSNFVKADSVFGPVMADIGTMEQKWSTSICPHYTLFLSLIALRMSLPCSIYYKLHMILDEMILGGQVIETSSEQIVKSVEEIPRFSPLPSPLPLHLSLNKQSSTSSFIPKSISERFTR